MAEIIFGVLQVDPQKISVSDTQQKTGQLVWDHDAVLLYWSGTLLYTLDIPFVCICSQLGLSPSVELG